MEEEKLEWSALCSEVAEQISPKLEEFVSTPFESAEKLRGRFIHELSKELEMPEFRKKIDCGVAVINAALPNLPEESQKIILDMVANYLTGISEGKAVFAPKGNEALDLARALGLNPSALKLIEEIGMQCVNEEKWEEGSSVFALLCHWQHLNADHWFHDALCSYFAQKFDEALACVDVAILLKSQQPEFYILKSAIAIGLHNIELGKQALHASQEAVKLYALELSPEWQQWKESLELSLK